MPNDNAVAIDTAAFQAADSYIKPSNGTRDPGAAASFEMILDAYCAGAELCLPLPEGRTTGRPALLLWDSWHETPSVVLTPSGVAEIATLLRTGLLRFIKGSAVPLTDWIIFQFTPAIVDDYVVKFGWELDDAAAVADFARDVMAEPDFVPLSKALNSRRLAGKLDTPTPYRSLVGGRFDSDDHLALSYLVSVYVRGWSYGWSLVEDPRRPEYRSAWVRNPALRDMSMPGRREPVQAALEFPWGRVIRELFDPSAPAMEPDFRQVHTLARWIRRNRNTILADAKIGSFEDAVDKVFGDGRQGPTRAEEAIVRALLKSGATLPYSDGKLEAKLLNILRFVAGLLNDKAGSAVERITADIRTTWLYRQAERTEATFRLTFLRSTFWDVFKNVGISDAASRAFS